ncbi:MAG: hypothetical protein QXN08_07230 [Nitrososphaerales archaeon]
MKGSWFDVAAEINSIDFLAIDLFFMDRMSPYNYNSDLKLSTFAKSKGIYQSINWLYE